MQRASHPKLPAGVWALGLVSLFMDISSEMIHALLPVFLVVTLGASPALLGLIEGIAEATACIVKLFSGALSDRWGRRKPLALLGYGLAALTKPLFPLADSALSVFVARFADRIGKGIRGAPRDALLADLTPPAQRGAAFGLRQSLDSVGAFAGPLLALLLTAVFVLEVRTVLWLAVLPALLAVAILALGVREPAAPRRSKTSPRPWSALRGTVIPRAWWWLGGIAVLFTLARFSEAFLVLRAAQSSLGVAGGPLALVVLNLACAASAYPAGRLSDRWPRARLLMLGCAVLVLADLLLAFGAGRLPGLGLGIALWGLHLGLTEGLLAALVSDHAPAGLRATAFGLFNLVRGLTLLAASVLAGLLWAGPGPEATFLAGAGFALLSLLAVRLAAPYLALTSGPSEHL